MHLSEEEIFRASSQAASEFMSQLAIIAEEGIRSRNPRTFASAKLTGGIAIKNALTFPSRAKEPPPYGVGDVVKLISGGPKMTVESCNETHAKCTWIDVGKQTASFLFPVLLSFSEPDRSRPDPDVKGSETQLRF